MTEYKLQLNVKVGQHLVNIAAADPTEFKANLQWVTENAANIVATATALEAVSRVAPLAAGTASVSTQPEQAAAPAAPAGQVPECLHGAKKWVPGGFSKRTNRAYDGFWACEAPQGQPKCRD